MHWAHELHQRNAIQRGLVEVARDDAIIVPDAEEISSADPVRRWHPGLITCRFDQLFCYYWINFVGTWAGSRFVPYAHVGRFADIQQIRHTDFPLLENGGRRVRHCPCRDHDPVHLLDSTGLKLRSR
jgi:hypothetical protein